MPGLFRSAIVALLCLCPLSVHAEKTVGIVVSGIGGNQSYEEQFSQYGEVVAGALQTIAENADDIVYLHGDAASKAAMLDNMDLLSQLQADTFYLVFIGHGTIDAETWRFNLPGEDLTTEELVAALTGLDHMKQVLVLATSASGAVLETLGQEGRHVVTATKSGGEINFVRFPEYLALAMDSAVADVDRNEILTLSEVFRFANERTQKYYDEQKLLASEHARLLGDSADRIPLARLGSLKLAGDNPAVAELLEQRLLLEDEFIALKARKASFGVAEYYDQLEVLLIDIAKVQQQIDTATGWVGTNE